MSGNLLDLAHRLLHALDGGLRPPAERRAPEARLELPVVAQRGRLDLAHSPALSSRSISVGFRSCCVRSTPSRCRKSDPSVREARSRRSTRRATASSYLFDCLVEINSSTCLQALACRPASSSRYLARAAATWRSRSALSLAALSAAMRWPSRVARSASLSSSATFR